MSNETNIKILVVTHKDCQMPDNTMYYPIGVGPNKDKLNSIKYRDDNGENIANKNNQYSELTALYWAWKNLTCDYLGIVHYRRYLSLMRAKSLNDILTYQEAETILKSGRIIVVKPRRYLESVANHYINCHKTQHENCKLQLKILRNTIEQYSPEYLESFDNTMNGHIAHMFNMFVMPKKDADSYCAWVFPILFETERRIVAENVSYERLMGSLSEFLLDVWLKANHKNVKEVNLYQTEMDFFKRAQRFIYRRFVEK